MWTRLWQNFLTNPSVIDFIIEQVKNNTDKNYETIEIGPWKCALTKDLVKIHPNLKVFEKDESFKEILKNCVKEENIFMWDFLSAKLDEIIQTGFFYAVWNLPYYITSPIFRKLTNPENKKIMKWWIFMIQKEVWEKIKTNATKKSLLWFLLNLNYEINYLKTIPASDFSPPPKVDSCLVSFSYHWKNKDIDAKKLFEILTLLWSYKNKTLWKIEKLLEKQWKQIKIPDNLKNKRLHELDWDEIRQIIKKSLGYT